MTNLRALLGPLKILDAVHRAGGISLAAGPLHLTTGAVSQRLKLLEQLLGIKLFQKQGREAHLTEAGVFLATNVGRSFDQIENVVQEALSLAHRRQKLRIKVMPTFAIRWLIPRLASLYLMHQDIDIEITTSASATFDTPLDDMDFVLRHGKGSWPQTDAIRIFDDAYVPVCSKGVAERLVRVEDLFDAQLIHSMMIPNAWKAWFESAGVAGTPSQPGLNLANAALCYQAAMDGLGVSMAQRDYVKDDLAAGRLVQPFSHISRTGLAYFLVRDSGKADSRTVAAFRAWLNDQASNPDGGPPGDAGSQAPPLPAPAIPC